VESVVSCAVHLWRLLCLLRLGPRRATGDCPRNRGTHSHHPKNDLSAETAIRPTRALAIASLSPLGSTRSFSWCSSSFGSCSSSCCCSCSFLRCGSRWILAHLGPYLHSLVQRGAGDQSLPQRAHTVHAAVVTRQRPHALATADAPNADGLVFRGAGDQSLPQRAHTVHLVCVLRQRALASPLWLLSIPGGILGIRILERSRVVAGHTFLQ